jgi:predicted  nucleic acid-binding Zn-ribbon protein
LRKPSIVVRSPTPSPLRAGRAAFLVDESGTQAGSVPEPARSGASRPVVPIGEFDSGILELDPEQATRVGDPSAALLGLADTSLAAREAPLEIGSDDSSPGGRGDPTSGFDSSDIRPADASRVSPKARLRTIAELHRTRGVGGDMRYVLTAIFGLRRARRELAALDAKEATLQQSRRRHLITLGRTAITAEGFEHAALGRARRQLAEIEEERAKHTAQVSATDAEQKRVTRDREDKAKQHATELAAIDAELAELAKKIEPLEKEIAGVTRRAADLRAAVRRIDEKIAFTEASLSAVKTQEEDRASIQAEIASLKADRKQAKKDEPELASALDALHPKLAKLEASRTDARRRREDLEQAERDDQRRTEEMLAAIGAKRKVLDRAAGDAETARDKITFELGELLYVDRPESMAPELSPIDAIDVELGTVDRRTMELREIFSSVDRWKLVRGAVLWILLFGAIGTIAAIALGLIPVV